MLNNVYISTASFRCKSLEKILSLCLENGFTNLELGSDLDYYEDNLEIILKRNSNTMKFLIHNYFPRPKKDFVLNLASNDNKILSKSIEHCKYAIDLSAQLGAPFYSMHAGLAFHAEPGDLGNILIELPRIPQKEAYENFVRSISELADYALKNGVKLAVENNVVADFNAIDGKNEIIFVVDTEEALALHRDVPSTNLFHLLDFGHLKLNSAVLKFDREDYYTKLLPYTIAFHLSDNDSVTDQHLPFDGNIWFRRFIKENREKIFVIEVQGMELDEIKECYTALERMLNQAANKMEQ